MTPVEIREQRFLKTLIIKLSYNPVLTHSSICLKNSSCPTRSQHVPKNMHIHIYCYWVMESVQVLIELCEWIKKSGMYTQWSVLQLKNKKSGHLLGKGIELKIISYVKLENWEQQYHIFSFMCRTHRDPNIHTWHKVERNSGKWKRIREEK